MKLEVVDRELALECPESIKAISLHRELLVGQGYTQFIEESESSIQKTDELYRSPHFLVMQNYVGRSALEQYGLKETIKRLDRALPNLSRVLQIEIDQIRLPKRKSRNFFVAEPNKDAREKINQDRYALIKAIRPSRSINIEAPIIGTFRQSDRHTRLRILKDKMHEYGPIVLSYGEVVECFHKVDETTVQ